MPASRDVIFRLLGEDLTSPAFNKAAASAEGAAARISRAGEKMGVAGRKLTHTVTLPIIGIAAASVKAATDFNSSMTRIQTQAGGTSRDVKILSAQVLAMKGAQQGPNELASALYHLKSVGMGNAQAMRALRVGSDLAAVGHANLEETVNALAGAWRTGIRGAKDFHQAAATVNAVIGAGNMTLEDFTAALGTGILPSAKTFGLTLKDVGSALALFTDEGVPADAAATRLRMTFSLLGAPSKAAEKQLKSIGLTGLTLANDMRKPNGLIRAVGDLKAHLEDPKYKLTLSERAALLSRAFGGGRSSSAILSMINNFDVLKQKQDQVTRSLGKYDQAVAAQKRTPAAQFHQELAQLQQTGVVIGNDLLPLVLTAAKDIQGLLTSFDNLSPTQKHIMIDAAIAVAALGPVLAIGGRLVKVFGFMGTAALKAVAFMIAPYRAAAVSAETSALQVQEAQLSEQLAVERASALIAVAEADKANAAAESAVRIAVSVEGTNSVLAESATAAALDSIDFAAAQQAAADAAVRAAAQTDAAWTAATVALRAEMVGASRSAFGLQTAMAGLGIGLTVGSFTRGASTSTKLLGALGSAGAGAAIGFSMGGPMGAAIGGLAGGLSSLAVSFLGTGDSANKAGKMAQAALLEQKQAADTLLGSLQSVNGAYNASYKNEIIHMLSQKGALALGVQAGIKPSTLLNYATGNLNQKQQAAVRGQIESSKNLTSGEYSKLDNALRDVGGAALTAQHNLQLEAAAAGHGILTHRQLGISLGKLRAAFAGTGRSLDATTAAGEHNRKAIRENLTGIQATAAWQLKHGAAVRTVAHAYESQVSVLAGNLHQLHFNSGEVQDLIARYGHLPKRVRTYLEQHGALVPAVQAIIDKYKQVVGVKSTSLVLKSGDVISRLDNVITRMHVISRGVTGYVNIITTGPGGYRHTVKAQAGGTKAAFGRGTIPPNTAFTVGEGGSPWSWEGGMTDSLGRASIYSNAQSRAMGFKAPTPYARGTGRGAGVVVRVFIGDREITDIVRTEVDEQLSFDAGRARAHA